MLKKVVVRWEGMVGRIQDNQTIRLLCAETPDPPERRKRCRLDKSINNWTPVSKYESYVHQILWQDAGTFYVSTGEILAEYEERARKEITMLIQNFLASLVSCKQVEEEIIWEGYSFKVRITPFKWHDKPWIAQVNSPLSNSDEFNLSESVSKALDRQKERKEKIEQTIRLLSAPQDVVVVDGEKIMVTWSKQPEEQNICACFPFSAEGIRGHILSLYSDCRDYKLGTASQRTFRWIEEEAPYLLGGKPPSEKFVANLGAAEFKADQARVTEANKPILKAGNTGLQRSLKEEGIPLSSFTGLEQPACHFAKLVCRRGVVGKALEHYRAEGKVRKIDEYRNYGKEIADKVLEFLLGKTDKIPSFPFRFFPESVKGNPVTIIVVDAEKYLFDRKKLVVYPRPTSGESWMLRVVWCDHADWAIMVNQEIRDSENDREEAVLRYLNAAYPNDIRKDW